MMRGSMGRCGRTPLADLMTTSVVCLTYEYGCWLVMSWAKIQALVRLMSCQTGSQTSSIVIAKAYISEWIESTPCPTQSSGENQLFLGNIL